MKKISRRRFLQITGVSAAAVGLTACGGNSGGSTSTAASGSTSAAPASDGKKYTLRASSNQAATSTIGIALAKFTDLINEKGAGKIEATANYGSELGSQVEEDLAGQPERNRVVWMDVDGLEEALGLSPVPLSTMGRGWPEERAYFLAAAAAGRHAATLLG